MKTNLFEVITKLDKLKSIANNQGLKGTVQLLYRRIVSKDKTVRRKISARYLVGEGIEIGALHSPLEVPATAKVRYVDRMSVAELRKQYPELANYQLVEVDIIDDGETLGSIADCSLDFVIANHMIEHCQNPIGTIEQHLRVLKSGGILYMAVPDKRYTFDVSRPVTSLEHLIRDYTEGPQWSKLSHFEEWSRLVEKVSEEDLSTSVQHLISIDYSIHFHVWTQVEFLEMLFYCQRTLLLPFKIELSQENASEFIIILRKT
ncbi:MAG: class I SAM-dependent methyltransferase [Mojavia pulchra JT2-VF2]|jgi:SAM-dependent methyltransferase|uniref:Class I SAM-dependent methyltransferase n=1 Tax=Mojavia pulchra JT2-VF2 TaxID=287848 RepID=A0A951PZ45_9NOST|nr:class I SAM-dependent methyltransferase [Mojavia pulchra JT2-VF2]